MASLRTNCESSNILLDFVDARLSDFYHDRPFSQDTSVSTKYLMHCSVRCPESLRKKVGIGTGGG